MTFPLLVPNPVAAIDNHLAAPIRLAEFCYYFLYLAIGTLAYSWIAIRHITVIGVGYTADRHSQYPGIWWFTVSHPGKRLVRDALTAYPTLQYCLDSDRLRIDSSIRKIVICFMAVFVLSVTVRRFGDLLRAHVSLER